MTTLDDAAERRSERIREYAASKHPASEVPMTAGEVTDLWNAAYAAATEAAAKKCEAEQRRLIDLPFDGKNINATSMAASLIGYLAAAIRGKGG